MVTRDVLRPFKRSLVLINPEMHSRSYDFLYIPYRIVPYNTILYHTIRYRILPYYTVRYHTILVYAEVSQTAKQRSVMIYQRIYRYFTLKTIVNWCKIPKKPLKKNNMIVATIKIMNHGWISRAFLGSLVLFPSVKKPRNCILNSHNTSRDHVTRFY